jgi:hypothetical protein
MNAPEPWLRRTLGDVHFVQRSLLHALEQSREDILRWCADLTDGEMNAHPCELPSIGFQMRHIYGSLDRLLTYAEGRPLDSKQFHSLGEENTTVQSREEIIETYYMELRRAEMRVREFDPVVFEAQRFVGRAQLPTTVGSLLIHCAEHTMRHTGQLITTAKVLRAMRQ